MTAIRIRAGRWVDSAKMMAAARAAESVDGVERALCFMATPANREEAASMGFSDAGLDGAGPDDLVLAVSGARAEAGLAAAEEILDAAPSGVAPGGAGPRPPRSLARAEGDLAVISVPGDYAALEAHKALGSGMDVLLFSDGVSREDEVALKRRAHERGLLVMGPGAGTAIIDGLALGFANVVARGSVGVVAAAGTGAQEVTVLVDRAGAGISRCYGTGGRDLTDEVGAITALDAIARLAADDETERDPVRLEAALARGRRAGAAGSGRPGPAGGGLHGGRRGGAGRRGPPGRDAGGGGPGRRPPRRPPVRAPGPAARRAGSPGARCAACSPGGTLCSEAAAILAERLGDVVTNAPAGRARRLDGRPRGHACLDLGEEEFTRGRPHPMIDPAARAERLIEEAADPEVGVLLIDVVLGYASHPDPAGVLAPVIREALATRPQLAVVGYVLGTEADPQVRSRQEAALAEAGVRLAPTNAAAARLAAALTE